MSRLAGAMDPDAPGLPRGRGRRDASEIGDEQRRRLLRAVIDVVAEKGLADTTIAEIVSRARVSRQSFYRQFDSKESCLVAAVDAGIPVVLGETTRAVRAAETASAAEQLASAVRRYLAMCTSEPEFSRAWAVDLALAGSAGLEKRNDYLAELARLVRSLISDSAAPAPSDALCLAAIGGCHELFARRALDDPDAGFDDLADLMIEFLTRALGLGTAQPAR